MNFPHLLYGGDYNPDQWPEATWLEDARLMQTAGVNLVSLGIFAWAKLEPEPGVFDFAWLDRLMDLLHAHGVAVNLATPTAAPPAWMVRLHPALLPVTAEGTTLWPGSRRHYCPHNPDYQRYATRIAAQLAERYQLHPALAMWHVDNEYGSHIGACYCDTSAAAFRAWLQTRYATLDQFNAAWGTAFWGQRYGAWEEVYPPRQAPTSSNPTQQLDWARFCSDSWLACYAAQRAVLKAVTPHIPVTTNFMGFHKNVDYFKFAPHEDVVANDSYPETHEADWPMQAGIVCDLIRSVGGRRPWLLMEQATSQVNWRRRNGVKAPGVLRLGSYQAIARGADGVMFFQWRQSRAGTEKHHSAMLPQLGTETRIWREVKALGAELRQLDELRSSQVKAEAAILMDWDNWWALELGDKPSNDLRLLPQLMRYYAPLFKRNLTVDFAHPDADLTRYKLVLAPNLYLMRAGTAANLQRYVQQGGTLVMGFFSGIVDEHEHLWPGGLPAPLAEVLGLVVEEVVPYAETQTNHCRTGDGPQFACSVWSEVLRLNGAQPLATYAHDYYAGGAAITQHAHGAGTAFYVGTVPEPAGLEWLLARAGRAAGLDLSGPTPPAGVELVRRTNGTDAWLFALNYSDEAVVVPLAQPGVEVLSGRPLSGSFQLGPKDLAIIKQAPPIR